VKLRELFKRTLERFIGRPSVYFVGSSYPSKGLTPERLAEILKEADGGCVWRQMELFSEMEEKDTHLFSVLQTRKLALCGLDFEIVPVDESRRQKKIAEFLKEKLEAIENFNEALFDLMDAVGKGFSVLEIIYEYADGEIWVKRLEFIEQKRFSFLAEDGTILAVPRILTEEDMVYGEELAENKFVYFRHKARSGITPRGGIIRPCAWMYLFKNYSLKDWVIFCERYAMPLRVGKYSPGAGDEEISLLKKAVLQLGADGAAVISDNTLIDLIESKARGEVGAYEKLCNYCDRQMSKAVLGQVLTVEPGSSGSYSLGKVQQRVRQDLLEADAKALAEVLRRDLLRPLVRFHFGDEPVPRFKFVVEEREDLEKSAKVLLNLVNAGFGRFIPVQYVHEQFGIPKPKEGEATLGDEINGTQAAKLFVGKLPAKRGEVNEKELDALKAVLDEAAEGIAHEILAPIFRLAKESSDLEELKHRLFELYPQLSTQKLEELLTKALFLAEVWGRLNASG